MTLALSSLLCNAYKYTPEKAYISISVASDKTRVFFEISDDGGGVDASILKEVFDSIYSESDDSDASKYGDAGFGITVCRTIVEAHGGILTAKDNNMGGTTFQIILGTSDADASDLVLADYAEMPEEFTDYE